MQHGQATEVDNSTPWKNQVVKTPEAMFGQVLFSQGSSIGPRIQKNYELGLTLSGQCDIMINGIYTELTPARAILLPPGTQEHVTFPQKAETLFAWCSMNPKHIPPAVRRRLRVLYNSVPCSETFKHIIASAFTIQPALEDGHHSIINNLALSLFVEYLNMKPRDDAVLTAVRYMEHHYGDEDCLTSAVRISRMSHSAVIYKFKTQLRTTPTSYLWNLRTEKGIELLRETGLSLSEIASRCGFKNPYHFSRLVAKLKGIPPGTVRKNAWLPATAALNRSG